MDGSALHQVTYQSPTCDAIVAYMLAHGLNIDVAIQTIMRDLKLTEVGGSGIGPYNGRVNKSERCKGSAYRLVLGKIAGTYRLIQLV